MLNTYTFYLQFCTPLHISNERGDYASGNITIHSDAMMAAIHSCWAKLGKAAWIAEQVNDAMPSTISSLFPFAESESGKWLHFFPRPLIAPAADSTVELPTEKRKELKKVQWLSDALFQQVINGQVANEAPVYGSFQSHEPLKNVSFIQSDVQPRVTVSRTGEDAKPFYMERFYFSQEVACGLFGLLVATPEAAERFAAGARLLADEGLGTDKTVGHGKFNFSMQRSMPINGGNGDTAIALGLYNPASWADFSYAQQQPATRYDVIKRGGWLSEPYSGWRKKNIYMLTPGSVLPAQICAPTATGLGIGGTVHDVRPANTHPAIPHPIYRSGKTLFVYLQKPH